MLAIMTFGRTTNLRLKVNHDHDHDTLSKPLEGRNFQISPLIHPRTLVAVYTHILPVLTNKSTPIPVHTNGYIMLTREAPELGNVTLIPKGTNGSNV